MRNYAAWCVIAFFALTGTACQTTDGQSEPPPIPPKVVALLSLEQACRAYAGQLRNITPHVAAGLLTDAEIAKIDLANAAADPICLGPPPVNISAAISTVSQAAVAVLLILEQREKAK
jgi:hypothetical protein